MTPDLRVSVGDSDITPILRDRLLSLAVTDEAGWTSDSVEISLDDRDGALEIPRRGIEMTVALGYRESALFPMGRFVVDEVALTGPPASLRITGRAADMTRTLKEPRTRDWHATTLGALVGEVAGRHGYSPRVDASLAALALPHVDQTGESDLHLVTRLARQVGATVKLAGGALIVVPRAGGHAASGAVLAVAELPRAHIRDWDATLAERSAFGSYQASYPDPEEGGTATLAVAGGPGPAFEIRRSFASRAEAEAAAQARQQEYQRGGSTLRLSLIGRPDIAAETRIRVTGLRPGLDGVWSVTRAEHRLDASGLATSLDTEIPAT